MKNVPKILKAMFVLFFILQMVFYTNLYAHKSIDATKLDYYLDDIEKSHQAMFSISISEKGSSIYNRSVGFIEPSLTIRSGFDTKYRIGEASKIFTSVMFMQMVDEKMIQLGTPLLRFFPEIPNAKNISMEDLLTEKLNISDFLSGGKYFMPERGEYVFDQMVIENQLKSHLDRNSFNEFKFNSANFLILGLIIEKLEGKTYGEILQERIVQPLQLCNTYDINARMNHSMEATSFVNSNDSLLKFGEWDLKSIKGSASILSSPNDSLCICITIN